MCAQRATAPSRPGRRDRIASGAYEFYFHLRRQVEARVARPPAKVPFEPSQVRRLLIVLTGLLGDSIMSLPAAAAARLHFPGAHVTVLTTPATRAVVDMASIADEILVADGAPLRLRPSARRANVRLEAQLAARRFDLAVVLLGDDYAPMLTRLAIPHRVFVAETAFAGLATATYSIGDPWTWGPMERARVWSALGLSTSPVMPTLAVPAGARGLVRARCDDLGVKGRFVALHAFGSTPRKWWPEEEVETFAREVHLATGVPTVLVGNVPTDAGLVADGPHRHDARGRFDLYELAALFESAACVVSTDSGPFHLAGILRRPGFGLFPAERPAHAHRYPAMQALVSARLAACARECRRDRCARIPCREMASLRGGEVGRAVVALLGDQG